jgi:hypothetical protein
VGFLTYFVVEYETINMKVKHRIFVWEGPIGTNFSIIIEKQDICGKQWNLPSRFKVYVVVTIMCIIHKRISHVVAGGHLFIKYDNYRLDRLGNLQRWLTKPFSASVH